MFLFHDGSVQVSGAPVALANMPWSDISALKLPDGSSPPLLSSVIASLSTGGLDPVASVASPSTTLYIELKSQAGAAQLAHALARTPHLLRHMHFIFISFSLLSLKILRQQFQAAAPSAAPLRLLWLVDNPRVPYPPEALDDGELTFDICGCSFGQFLDANHLRQLFLEVAPEGLGIQFVKCWADTRVRSD